MKTLIAQELADFYQEVADGWSMPFGKKKEDADERNISQV